MVKKRDPTPQNMASDYIAPDAPSVADQQWHDIQTVNAQLLIAGLREQTVAEQLRNQLAFTRTITTSLGEGVYVLDTAGRCLFVNPAAEQMLGWSEADLLGKQLWTMIPIHAVDSVDSLLDDVRVSELIHSGTGYQNLDVVITRCDGTCFPATYSAAPMIINEQTVGITASFRDMTEIQRLRHIQEEYIALLSDEHAMLETQVHERTSELERTNGLLQAEINERKRTEQARQHLLQQLVTAQEEERSRIARELHDQMGQSVAALMLAIKALHDQVGDTSDLQAHVVALRSLGSQLGQDVRTLAVQLRPPALDHFGLLPTLHSYIEQWSVQASIVVDIYTTGLDHVRLPEMIEITVFRMVQEALTNIMRHAHARRVGVIMHRRTDSLQLIVEDDGVGFDIDLERQRPVAERRLGLMGMEERVMQLGGTLTIESSHGNGTTVFVALPLTAAL